MVGWDRMTIFEKQKLQELLLNWNICLNIFMYVHMFYWFLMHEYNKHWYTSLIKLGNSEMI